MPSRKRVAFEVESRLRPQAAGPDLWLAFAPIKRIEVTVEKASELGAAALMPVVTRRTNVGRVNLDRLRAVAVEAAEQCDRLSVPEVRPAQSLDAFLTGWPPGRRLYYLDETGAGAPIARALREDATQPCAFLVGPEGGFEPAELQALAQTPSARGLGLGPRLLRAETAAMAALTCWQALKGDWSPG
jgi:16S rRNA (uracil1498-N3)-methyltransferase